jgi:hypothetical protein
MNGNSSDYSLSGKTVFITGASRGIGKAMRYAWRGKVPGSLLQRSQ